MADEEMPLLHSRSGGRRGNNNNNGGGGAAAPADAESPEPALKRQRQAPAEPSRAAAAGAGGEAAAAAPLPGRAVEEALKGDRAVPDAWVSGEPAEGPAPAGAGEGWSCTGSGAPWWGLVREEPPPSPHQRQLPRGQSQGEDAEAGPAGEAAETAIGCGPAQSSNGAAEAERAPQTDNIFFSDEIIANGFHSCDSDEDDRTSHASSSDWTPRPRIGPYTFVQQHLMIGTDPRAILKDLLPETIPPPELDNMTLWQIVVTIFTNPRIPNLPQLEVQCSFATASCLICKYKVDCEVVRGDIFNQVVPRCPRCSPDEPLAIMKPEIVFFGENLPEQFHRAMKYDKDEVDLLIVIGSSLKVRPVALIPSSIPHEVPQILINREPLPHLHFDVELLGDCDVIINELCHRLGGEYSKLCNSSIQLSEITEKPPRPHREFEKHLTELPPTPLNISESSSSSDRIPSQDSQVMHSEHSDQYKAGNSDVALESKENSIEEKPLEVHNSLENSESTHDQLETTEHVKEPGSNQEENKERNEKISVETVRKCCLNRCAKEQISKRLDGTQYLFSPPNRYIFHGAEVYSDSEDDVISSSSCGSSSGSGSCRSPSLDVEEESELEDYYNGIEEEEEEEEEEADTPDREEENGFEEDGTDLPESVDESISINQTVEFDSSSDKL
ncbi:NAD-dependent protein deacetylase sirtuin-1 [Ahaetulla prasina]|uniref:NAD-dependent protein deacetylase sirtuin-1 n=1 Tax=Ahaetulla prasina TaxID=499056 RepID=UPI0026488196|nr:NAD-dependent protein deacetylase sirtuin-1 [Ahaetulla prasina]